ncbi:MAG: mRNA surveillance protein pelota [Candidatus Woesearchaeota archaeon]
MRILSKNLKKGTVGLLVENYDDLWYLSQIVMKGDLVSGSSSRKIEKGNDKVRTKILVKIEVEKTGFQRYSKDLRISGKILECNDEDVPKGSYHSLTITPRTKITLFKNKISNYVLDILKEASKPEYKFLICIFDREEALFAVINKQGYKVLSNIKGIVDKKYAVNRSNEKTSDFYEEINKNLEDYDRMYNPSSIIIASPGFWSEYLTKKLKESIEKKSIISSCAYVDESSINEIMKRPEIKQALKQSRIAEETQIVEEVLAEISKDGLAVYGFEEVEKAVDYGAVKSLLILDSKMQEISNNEKLASILNKTEDFGGKIIIIDSEFEPGKKLKGLGGIAALTRFKVS